jgi:4-coumarate--CoA ligase
MLTHRNLVTNADQAQVVLNIQPEETTVVFLPLFHIYALEIMAILYLAQGGRLVTMPRFDLPQYLELCARFKSPRLWIVPPVAIALAKHPLVDEYDLSHVVIANSAAAPLGADVAGAVAARLSCSVTQGYGMTELSPVCHIGSAGVSPAGSVGRTIPNTQCRVVVPESGVDAEPGAEGEIWVRGPQVMKGYLNRPDATAETVDADGWLHTGDVGRFDADGNLYITDRVKELIKYKGFQIAPAELEAALLTHPGVADVAVIGVADADAGEVPMAFVVPAAEAPTLSGLQAFCAERLAHYKEIQRLEIVTEVPKSASGKILRRVLRDRVAAATPG